MRVGRAVVPLPPANIDREPAHQLATDDVGMGDQPAGPPPPAPRLKLIVKKPEIREVRAVAPGPATTRTSRTGRVVKPPTSFAPAPAAAAGKRKPGFRKKEANIVCVHCGRGNSPGSNQIVFCDGCNTTWHQKCSDPPIPDEVIEVRDKEWFCTKCKPVRRPSTKAQSSQATGKKKTKTASASSKVQHQPRQAPGLDVGGNQFTMNEQRGYLTALSHTQLVELVVKIAAQNPTVAIFPANLKNLPASQFAGQPTSSVNSTTASSPVPGPSSTANFKKRGRAASAAAADEQSGAAPARPTKRSRTISAPAKPTTTTMTTITMTNIKAAAPSPRTYASTRSASAKSSGTATSSTSRLQSTSAEPDLSRVSSPEESELETDEDDFDEIEDHRLYPRSGNGFSTSTDPADLNILAEDAESQTFSHRLHGPAKQAKQTTKQTKATKKKGS